MGNGMNKILPGLYLGNFRDSRDKEQLSKNNITHILSVFESATPFFSNKQYYLIVASDSATEDLSKHFEGAIRFIHQARLNGGNVLVHCLAGVSRSTTLIVAYLMIISGLGWREVLDIVQSLRSCASPNFGFQRQLLDLQYNKYDEVKKRFLERFPNNIEKLKEDENYLRKISEELKKKNKEKEELRGEVEKITGKKYPGTVHLEGLVKENEKEKKFQQENNVSKSTTDSVAMTTIIKNQFKEETKKLTNNSTSSVSSFSSSPTPVVSSSSKALTSKILSVPSIPSQNSSSLPTVPGEPQSLKFTSCKEIKTNLNFLLEK